MLISPLEHLPTFAETVPDQFKAFMKTSPQTWNLFVQGLRTYLHSYDLPQLIDPGLVKLNLVTDLRPHSSLTAQARFRTERVLVWLVSPMTNQRNQAMHPFRRLEFMAGTTIGLLNSTYRTLSAPRWLHIAWLSTRLLQQTARDVLEAV